MSWQDDLRELDQALAQGHVSADEYRKRRDKLLATAAGNPAASPQPAQPAPAQPTPAQPVPPAQPEQQLVQPTPPPETPQPAQPQQPQPQSPGGPFAPPFRWEPTPDSTQVVTNTNTDNPDRTQVVSQQPNPFGQQQQHSPESDRTQTLRPLSQPSQSQPAPPWQAQQPSPAAPPWGMDDGPVMMPSPTWLSHGPEVFETTSAAKKRSKTPWIVAAVVVILGLGAGAFFLFGNKGGGTDPAPGPTEQTQAAPTTTVRPKDDLEVAQLDGKADDVSSVRTFADAEAKEFLTPDEKTLYKAGDPGKTRMISVTLDGGVKAYIFTTELASAANATTAATALAAQQIAYGMKQFSGVPQGVLAANIEKAGTTPATIRAHYVHKSTVARIQVYGDDMAQVTSAFNDVLDQQLAALAITS